MLRVSLSMCMCVVVFHSSRRPTNIHVYDIKRRVLSTRRIGDVSLWDLFLLSSRSHDNIFRPIFLGISIDPASCQQYTEFPISHVAASFFTLLDCISSSTSTC